MNDQLFPAERYRPEVMFARGVALGGLGGAAMGATVGTFVVPILGTGYGCCYGLVFGVGVGVPAALMLVLVAPRLAGALMAAIAGAVDGEVWSVLANAGFQLHVELSRLVGSPLLWFVVGTLASAIVGAWAGPRAVFRRDGLPALCPASMHRQGSR